MFSKTFYRCISIPSWLDPAIISHQNGPELRDDPGTIHVLEGGMDSFRDQHVNALLNHIYREGSHSHMRAESLKSWVELSLQVLELSRKLGLLGLAK